MQLQAKYVILGLLRTRAMSGYEIKKSFEGDISFFFDASYGSVYPTLNKLEQEGLIVKHTIVQTDRPNRHDYTITEAGIEALALYLQSPLIEDKVRSDLTMRLYFGTEEEDAELADWIRQGLEQHTSKLSRLSLLMEQHEAHMPKSTKLSLLYGIGYHQGQVEALQRLQKELEG
ncbi:MULTISPECIES: PadR family transcriptional regulator [unclassified Paenibacillus]|uniref:PadR family transcriptional regulator n=1 Tax=unclassified Paenibacillus TaxID=185978 RepID=UPI0015A2CE3C|nr:MULTISPECIES: PadR family transcriptional regulator [unclassified Paenibacillus]